MVEEEARPITGDSQAEGRPRLARRWWLRMLVASAALVAVLLGAYFLTPVARLHYYAWKYRTGRDAADSLKTVAEVLVQRKVSPEMVEKLLGRPRETEDYWDGSSVWSYSCQPLDVVPVSASYDLTFKDGRLVSMKAVSRQENLSRGWEKAGAWGASPRPRFTPSGSKTSPESEEK